MKKVVKLNEKKLHSIIQETIRCVINESKQGLQSPKLYSLIQQHGGIGDNRPGLGHGMHHRAYGNFSNLTDEDIIGVFTYEELQNMYRSGNSIDHGKWIENNGLRLWAEKHGFKFNGADEISEETLGDGSILLFIDRGGRFDRSSLYKHKKGDWKDYYDKTEARRRNRQLKAGDNHPTRPIQKASEEILNNPYIWRDKKDVNFQRIHGNELHRGNGWTNADRREAINNARQGKDMWGFDIDER